MKLGVIGCGKMGSALLGGIIESGVCRGADTLLFDSHEPSATDLSGKCGAGVATSNAEVMSHSDVVLVCVKPQGMKTTLNELGDAQDKLLISIAAGVKIDVIESALKNRHRVIRVMPNTPALVGKGASAFSRGSAASDKDAALTRMLLESVGYVCEVPETDLDAVTALSGSGPAYIFLLIEALVEGAVAQGLEPEFAHHLAVQTVGGAALLAEQSEQTPTTLRENVTSPNGTTFAALESFRADDFSAIVKRALDAARDRSIELGK